MKFAANRDKAKSIAEKNNTTVTYRVGGLDFAEQAKAEKAEREKGAAGGTEDGWGVNLAQNQDVIFATFFVHGPAPSTTVASFATGFEAGSTAATLPR